MFGLEAIAEILNNSYNHVDVGKGTKSVPENKPFSLDTMHTINVSKKDL